MTFQLQEVQTSSWPWWLKESIWLFYFILGLLLGSKLSCKSLETSLLSKGSYEFHVLPKYLCPRLWFFFFWILKCFCHCILVRVTFMSLFLSTETQGHRNSPHSEQFTICNFFWWGEYPGNMVKCLFLHISHNRLSLLASNVWCKGANPDV